MQFNLLKIASRIAPILNKNKRVGIVKRVLVEDEANKYKDSYTTLYKEVIAQVQYNSFTTNSKDNYLQGINSIRVYIVGDKADTISFFDDAEVLNTLIIVENKVYEAVEIDKYFSNGWIKIQATLNNNKKIEDILNG